MNTLKTTPYKRFKLEFWHDEYSESPRNWDNIGKLICFHKHYDISDKHDFYSVDDLKDFIRESEHEIIYLPVYAYEHGGITLNTAPYSCRWDSYQVGVIYAYKSDMISSGITSEEEMYKTLIREVKIFDGYLQGNVYGFSIFDDSDELLESCGGFIDDMAYCESEAKSTADYFDNKLPKQYELNFA